MAQDPEDPLRGQAPLSARGEAPPARSAARVVLVTAPDEGTAARLARDLVEERLAACVNALSGVRSTYRWQGAVEEAVEVLLIVKTSAERVGEVESFLRRHHPYDVPECVALEPSSVEARYASWLLESVVSEPGGSAGAGGAR